jgi:hypothetical protein
VTNSKAKTCSLPTHIVNALKASLTWEILLILSYRLSLVC